MAAMMADATLRAAPPPLSPPSPPATMTPTTRCSQPGSSSLTHPSTPPAPHSSFMAAMMADATLRAAPAGQPACSHSAALASIACHASRSVARCLRRTGVGAGEKV